MTNFRGQRAEGRRQKATLRPDSSFTILHSAFCVLLVLVALSLPLSAQEGTDRYTPIRPLPLGDILLNLPTSHIPGEGVWEIKFTHRFNQSLDQGSFSDRVHSLWGLDSNADVGFGVSFAPTRDLQLSLYRSNTLDDIELAGKYVVVQQAEAIPLSAAVRVGGDWRTEAGLKDRTSLFGQVILSHQFGRRLELFAVPTYVTKAGRAVVGADSLALFNHAFNVPVGVAFAVRPGLSLCVEILPKNHDLAQGVKADLGWAIGLKRAIGGHYFEIMVTNSNATHADQYVTSTYQGTPLSRGDLHLGFNIERRFGKRGGGP
jgi:hypothetical protein